MGNIVKTHGASLHGNSTAVVHANYSPNVVRIIRICVQLSQRYEQLVDWTGNPADIPTVTWIAGFFNPQSFLTAIKQMTAQRTGDALDKLVTFTDITKITNHEEIESRSRDGAYLMDCIWRELSGRPTMVRL